jgi:hypothetical protein
MAAALALALSLLVMDAVARIGRVHDVTAVRWGPLPVAVRSSGRPAAPGLSERDQVLPNGGADSYHWIMQTQEMLAGGGWRLRRTSLDNAPDGREVHWSSALVWCLAAMGRAADALTGIGPVPGVERAAPYAQPILHACLILTLSALVHRRFGATAASGLAIAMAASPRFAGLFQAGMVDHHGLAATAGLSTALFIAAAGGGWVRASREPSAAAGTAAEPAARRWFVASAIAGAAGLWISAASQVPVLAGISAGALFAARLRKTSQDRALSFDPGLWRLWGWTGAAATLFFYLLEYAPSHFGMRLEVNHPLYAVAWAGAGEILFRAGRWLAGGRIVESRADAIALPVAAAAVGLLPALVALSPERTFWVADRFLWALHRDYIMEFESVARFMRDLGSPGRVLLGLGLIPLVAIPALLLLRRRGPDAARRAALAVTLAPALAMTALGALQTRWIGNAEGMWIAVSVTVLSFFFGIAPPLPATRRVRALAIACGLAVLLPGLAGARLFVERLQQERPYITRSDSVLLVMRDVAHRIVERAGDRPVIALSGPTSTSYLMYFGGIRGVGTLYWENLPGLEAAAAIYSSDTPERLLDLLRRRGVTHVVAFSWERFSGEYVRLAGGAFQGGEGLAALLPRGMSGPAPPQWARPIPYEIPGEMPLAGQRVLLFEIQAEQTAEEWRYYMGEFALASSDWDAAIAHYRGALDIRPDYPDACVGLARALMKSGPAGEALPWLDRAKDGVAAADRSRLAGELVLAGEARVAAGDDRLVAEIYRRAIAFDPANVQALNNAAWVLATTPDPALRDGAQAVRLAEEAVRIAGGEDPTTLDTLAAALAASGRWDEAVSAASRAADFARAAQAVDVAAIEARLALYRDGRPYRER